MRKWFVQQNCRNFHHPRLFLSLNSLINSRWIQYIRALKTKCYSIPCRSSLKVHYSYMWEDRAIQNKRARKGYWYNIKTAQKIVGSVLHSKCSSTKTLSSKLALKTSKSYSVTIQKIKTLYVSKATRSFSNHSSKNISCNYSRLRRIQRRSYQLFKLVQLVEICNTVETLTLASPQKCTLMRISP